MRYKPNNERRAVILMVVLSLLTLFAIVGISFVLYAQAEAASARVARQAETQQRADVPPEQALAFFLSQLIYDVPDTVNGVGSGVRGHSLARTMYGYNYSTTGPPNYTPNTPNLATNIIPFNGVGRLHYQNPAVGQDDYISVNYTWFGGAVRDPERYGSRTITQVGQPSQPNPYLGGNASYTYPDLNNFFLAAVTANGTVLTPSFHRKWLFNPNNNFNDMSNPNWTNGTGKYLTLRPRPIDHGNLFPAPDDAFGDVKNLVGAPGGNDSIWIDIGAPVMTAPDGTLYKMLVAPLIMDLDGRINLGTAGNILGPGNTHVSNQGWGSWEVNLSKALYADVTNWGNPNTPPEWVRLFLGTQYPSITNPMPPPPVTNQTVYGKYGVNGTPSTPGASATSGTPAHFYMQGDVNGLNETTPASASSRPAPPGFGGTATYGFPLFAQGYLNGGTELTNHPLLYNVFRPPWYNGTDDRIFHASDMEALLRPNSNSGTNPVDSGSSTLASDLLRLCPTNFGPSATNPRFRNLVTTLSMDLGAPGVSPYWWNGMPAPSYLIANPNPQLPPSGQAVPFPSLPPTVGTANAPGTNPPTSEFSLSNAGTTNWRSLSANTISYMQTANPAGPPPYTTPGARIRLNRPLPPYPHMGSGVTPPYTSQPPNTPSPYGVAYNLGNAVVANQYQAAVNARQALANDIYRRLLATAGILPVTLANLPNPLSTDLAPRRWLAQLAVNIVDFIDEDDINTPFNFYTPQDNNNQPLNPPAPFAANPPNPPGTQGPDDNANPAALVTGANPDYWVFGTEIPKVVLSEVLAEAQNSVVGVVPVGVTVTENVKLWIELFNTMPTTGGANNTQVQDSYRVPLYVTNPAGGGYSPYRISIAQYLMNQPNQPNPPPGLASVLPDGSANVLGKAYVAAPFPQSTTDIDFSTLPLLSQGLTTPPPATPPTQLPFPVPVSGNTINAGVDPQNYFLIGPKTYPANPNAKNNTTPYQNPFVTPGLPNNIPVVLTDSVSYTPNWANLVSTTDERTTGLTVLLRRLANPYLPLQVNPALPNYNPYVTVDYVSNVPIQSNEGLLLNPPMPPMPLPPLSYSSRGKTQPYAALTQPTVANTAPSYSPTLSSSPVVNQTGNVVNGVTSTFGKINSSLPPSGHYDWLVHLDRPPISPMELLHVSAWPPYQLTQRFMLGSDNLTTANMVNPPNPANALNMFGHYAPWFDAPPGGAAALANMACPWWFDASMAPVVNPPTPPRSHRLYRLFEFLESGDWATGVNGIGRIPGKVNINTIWDPEILQALIDANMSMGIGSTASQYPPNTSDLIAQIFNNLVQSRSPHAGYNLTTGTYSGTIGPVNMGTGSDDRPFLPLSAGFTSGVAGTQYPNSISVTTDTLLRTNNPFSALATYPQPLPPPNPPQPAANNWLLFQNYTDSPTNPISGHPYLQTQLLTKLYNKVTTRSNTFAVFLTAGFFQVMTNPSGQILAVGGQPYVPGVNGPPQLGPEIGRSEGRQIRHRMFAIVDRTNLSAFSTTSSTPVTGPTIPPIPPMAPNNPTGNATITLNSGLPTNLQAGMQLVIEPGTANEETVAVQSFVQATAGPPATPATVTANFTKAHPNAAVTGNPSTTYQIIQRGNPGPQPQYNPRTDPLVVPYFSIID